MDIVVPPAVLSLSRKPVDYFTFNPWLPKLPEYLSSGPGPLGQRLEKVWSLALFWFSSDAPFGVEWGFAVSVADLARFLLMSLLVGAYFALGLVSAVDPEGEVSTDEQGHQQEPSEVSDRHREAPLDAVGVVRGEPEQGEVPDLLEPLAEEARPRDQVVGELDQPGIEGEVIDGLAGERQENGRHPDVHDEDRGRRRREDPLPRPDGGGDASERSAQLPQQ